MNINYDSNTISDFITKMSAGNIEANRLVRECLKDSEATRILFEIYKLDIVGESFVKLYKYCADSDLKTLDHTVIVLQNEGYNKEEIKINLSLDKPVPFIISYSNIASENNSKNFDYFGPLMDGWDKFIKANRKIVLENIELELLKERSEELEKMTHSR